MINCIHPLISGGILTNFEWFSGCIQIYLLVNISFTIQAFLPYLFAVFEIGSHIDTDFGIDIFFQAHDHAIDIVLERIHHPIVVVIYCKRNQLALVIKFCYLVDDAIVVGISFLDQPTV